jgi:hypothetical protein
MSTHDEQEPKPPTADASTSETCEPKLRLKRERLRTLSVRTDIRGGGQPKPTKTGDGP